MTEKVLLNMKKRVLTGVQPSGRLHIGNYFGTIKRMIEYQEKSELFLMIASLHSLTTLDKSDKLEELILEAAMDMLALGVDPEKSYFWVQSDVPEVAELSWILACGIPMGMLERATSYKDKVAKGLIANVGLFSYPVLQAADILIDQAHLVPVGKDQKQHLEMARDIAMKFNHRFGEIFVIPEAEIPEDVAVIPGTDGQKMSKSYGNTIPIFADDREWKKAVMSIVTDSKGVEDKKDPEKCTVFALYKLMATPTELKALAERYRKGGMGYGEAKQMLLFKLKETFGVAREKRKHYEARPEDVRALLKKGAEKVRPISIDTMEKVRKATGLWY